MTTSKNQITIIKPDDWHLHLRTPDLMQDILGHTFARFQRALVMPNLVPPITNTRMAQKYRDEIIKLLPIECDFEPIMTLYLTENTTRSEIIEAARCPFIAGIKLYPAGATTNSQAGVSDLSKLYPVFRQMQKEELVLEIHAESTNPGVDIFDREADFIDNTLTNLVDDYPELKIVFEHITTSNAVEFVKSHKNMAATITPHHLLLNRNAIFQGGLNPHHYCLPVLKRENHRLKLIQAATRPGDKFFAGTDSAPHARHAKESSCGCAGIYNSHIAIEVYAEIFEKEGRLDQLESFTSRNGARFYNRPLNDSKITLIKEEWVVPQEFPFGDQSLVPFQAGEKISWKIN